MKRIGLLTSGGDCQALNATMRGVVKGLSANLDELEVYGFMNGYKGLIYGDYRLLTSRDFSGILTKGGTILGSSRQPFKLMREPDERGLDKVEAMKQNYYKLRLDCLVILGGNGTQKTANLLREEGLNIIHLPKTIDNDIYGTDMTFGFYSAVNIATDAIDCIHTTAASHNRVFIVEVMGHKVGWLTLHAGIAGGADIILLPEMPYNFDAVLMAVKQRNKAGKRFSILAVAEGAISQEDAQLSKKEYQKKKANSPFPSVSYELGKKIQDAHEAIRPTDVTRTPAAVKEFLSRDQFRLYQLVWKRFIASRMQPARYETTSVKIAAGQYRFTVAASKVSFEGFKSVYTEAGEAKEENNVLLKGLDMDSVLTKESLDTKQHFTQPPAHYTEATLVKTLEELGIGRPSTYAPTISTIIARRYVAKENKNLYLTEIGEVVNHIMKQSFPSIVDVNFTANMESLLDGVAEGKVRWKTIIENFYPDLEAAVEKAEKELEQVKIEDEVTDVICEQCGRNMVVKYGPHGKFLACPGFPDCRNTKPYLEKIGVPCPICGKDVVIRKTKKGRRYYGCEDNPECEFMSWQKPSTKKCPRCGAYMLEKGNKLVCSDEQCGYVENIENTKEN